MQPTFLLSSRKKLRMEKDGIWKWWFPWHLSNFNHRCLLPGASFWVFIFLSFRLPPLKLSALHQKKEVFRTVSPQMPGKKPAHFSYHPPSSPWFFQHPKQRPKVGASLAHEPWRVRNVPDTGRCKSPVKGTKKKRSFSVRRFRTAFFLGEGGGGDGSFNDMWGWWVFVEWILPFKGVGVVGRWG